MNTIVRNFMRVLFRFKAASFLNIAGLSVAFAAFLVLMMQVTYEWGYDRFHKNTDRLYRLEIVYNEWGSQVVLSRPLIDAFIASSPHIEKGTFINAWDDKRYITVEQDGKRQTFHESVFPVYPTYADVFDFTMIEGGRNAMDTGDKVLIPENMAHRFFGNRPAVGQILIGEGWTAEVGGVYKDFPSNSIVRNAVYQKIPDHVGAGIWGQNNFECYLLLDNKEAASEVLANFRKNFKRDDWKWGEKDLRLVSLPDVYFETDANFDSQKQKGSITQVRVLLAIAVLIVIIAAINFMNFSNAMVPMRLRSINTQKVLGGKVSVLRLSMMLEAVGFCLLSYLIALLIVKFISETRFTDLVSGGISLEHQIPLLIGCTVFILIVGLVSGSWPAWYITSFQPALVLKGNFGLSPKGRSLRNMLVGIQFVASFILAIAALFITWQNNYMLTSPLGFDQQKVVMVKLNDKLIKKQDALKKQLTASPEIESVSLTSRVVGVGEDISTWGRTYEGRQMQIQVIQTDPDILKVLGAPLLEGRDFLPEDMQGEGTFLFNERARSMFDMKVGGVVSLDWEDLHRRETIAGFIPDIKYNSFRDELQPFGFFVSENNMAGRLENVMVRVRKGVEYGKLKKDIDKVLKSLDPDYLTEISLFGEIQENIYRKELLLGKQITFFSLVTLFVSLVGVFGVVMFESEYKRKEIGIRKVFGASVSELLRRFNKTYLQIVVLCFIIAAPIAWYGINRWQENFAYKAPLHWWIFILAFLVIMVITLATVTFQNWRAANENPVDSIKTE